MPLPDPKDLAAEYKEDMPESQNVYVMQRMREEMAKSQTYQPNVGHWMMVMELHVESMFSNLVGMVLAELPEEERQLQVNGFLEFQRFDRTARMYEIIRNATQGPGLFIPK